MKRTLSLLIGVAIALTFFLTSCNTDDQAPKIYLLGPNGAILQEDQNDTVVLLYTKYVDPGIKYEDNATKTVDIDTTSDEASIFTLSLDGYIRRAEVIAITYTATDLAGNMATKTRNVTISNISTPFVNSYATTRSTFNLNDDTVYNSSVVADTRVPGRLRFPKVYAHYNNGQKSYFRINADLFSPELSENYSETIAYMGTASDNETPFFANLSYEQATDSILTFDMLKIDAQYYTDTLGNQVYISGVTEPGHNYPLSRIEYLGTSKTIKRIVLELNVTKNDAVDRVIEVYIPN